MPPKPKRWGKSCQFFFYISREDYVNRLCWDQIRWLTSDKFLPKPMDPTIYTAWEVHTSRIMSFLLLIFSNHFRQRLFWCAAPLSQRPTYSTSLLGEAPFWKKPYAHLTEEKGSKAIRAMPIYTDHFSKWVYRGLQSFELETFPHHRSIINIEWYLTLFWEKLGASQILWLSSCLWTFVTAWK